MGVPAALLLVVATATGCGRFGFGDDVVGDAPGDGLPDVPVDCTGPDEDGDGWPDVCDNCPTEVNPTQADRGEVDAGNVPDGVGDACDPRPALSGDFVMLFAPHDTLFAGYDTHYEAWSYPGNGALRLGAPGRVGGTPFPTPSPVTRIDSLYTVVDPVGTDQQWFGSWVDVGAGRDAIFASIRNVPNNAISANAAIKEQSGVDVDRYSPDLLLGVDNLVVGQRFRIVMDTEETTRGPFALTLTDLDTQVSQTTRLAVTIPQGDLGRLEAFNVVVDVAYLVVYGR